jgi:hypothetical protein
VTEDRESFATSLLFALWLSAALALLGIVLGGDPPPPSSPDVFRNDDGRR